MFQSFPLGDKSSVNLRGDFHVENVTTFEEFLKEEVAADSEMVDADAEAIAAQEETSTPEIKTTGQGKGAKEKDQKSTMDIDKLYPVFWSLQHSFSNPPSLFEGNNLEKFKTSLEATLAKFKVVPKVIQSGDPERNREHDKREGEENDTFADTYNPKYLTSRDLFKLEVRTFRHARLRHHD